MVKSCELGESKRAALYYLRVAGHSFAEVAKKSRFDEVNSIQNCAEA